MSLLFAGLVIPDIRCPEMKMDWLGSRKEMYRAANKTFRYHVYLTIELIILVAILGNLYTYFSVYSVSQFEGAPRYLMLGLVVVFPILHHVRMTFYYPWIVLGALLFGTLFEVLLRFLIEGTHYELSTTLFALYHLWRGETEVKRRALEALQ